MSPTPIGERPEKGNSWNTNTPPQHIGDLFGTSSPFSFDGMLNSRERRNSIDDQLGHLEIEVDNFSTNQNENRKLPPSSGVAQEGN